MPFRCFDVAASYFEEILLDLKKNYMDVTVEIAMTTQNYPFRIELGLVPFLSYLPECIIYD